MWFQGDQLQNLREIEISEEASTSDATLKKGDEYAETCEDDEDII